MPHFLGLFPNFEAELFEDRKKGWYQGPSVDFV